MIIEIPLEPKTKKNSSRIVQKRTKNGKSFPILLPSEAYSKYEKDCEEYIPFDLDTINYPINLKCTFYMQTKRKTDLTNLLQAICDILVKYKVIEDDNYNIIRSFDGSTVFYDHDNPRTIIEITKKEE